MDTTTPPSSEWAAHWNTNCATRYRVVVGWTPSSAIASYRSAALLASEIDLRSGARQTVSLNVCGSVSPGISKEIFVMRPIPDKAKRGLRLGKEPDSST